jgi:exopolysaccharide biosynthesis protein
MKRASIFRVFLIVTMIVFANDLNAQITGFKKIHWEREKIAPGLTWKSSHTVLNDSIPQNINILIVNLHKREIFLSYNPKKNITVSKQATEAGALAAVNAGFFNIKDGGSATYIRTGGKIVDTDTVKKWSRNSNMTGSVLINKKGNVTIARLMSNSWYNNHPEYPDVLVTGPLLLSEKEKVQLPLTSLVTTKHPRTVIGKRGTHKILFITLDGRTDQAIGMTLTELADFMLLLHCKDAVNLDGGGSTTMWVSGMPFNGVVNMPCDNKKFDHEGERAVSDILIVR